MACYVRVGLNTRRQLVNPNRCTCNPDLIVQPCQMSKQIAFREIFIEIDGLATPVSLLSDNLCQTDFNRIFYPDLLEGCTSILTSSKSNTAPCSGSAGWCIRACSTSTRRVSARSWRIASEHRWSGAPLHHFTCPIRFNSRPGMLQWMLSCNPSLTS